MGILQHLLHQEGSQRFLSKDEELSKGGSVGFGFIAFDTGIGQQQVQKPFLIVDPQSGLEGGNWVQSRWRWQNDVMGFSRRRCHGCVFEGETVKLGMLACGGLFFEGLLLLLLLLLIVGSRVLVSSSSRHGHSFYFIFHA